MRYGAAEVPSGLRDGGIEPLWNRLRLSSGTLIRCSGGTPRMTQLYHSGAGVSSVKPKLYRFTNLTTASENCQKNFAKNIGVLTIFGKSGRFGILCNKRGLRDAIYI